MISDTTSLVSMLLTSRNRARAIRPDNMPTAAVRVLALPELLSLIFAHLDFKELIRATHVCQGSKATITQDPAA